MSSPANLVTVLAKLYDEYSEKTPSRLKIVDGFLVYVLLTGIIQFVYCCLVGTFPFNSFLSGFISCVGTFILAGFLLHGGALRSWIKDALSLTGFNTKCGPKLAGILRIRLPDWNIYAFLYRCLLLVFATLSIATAFAKKRLVLRASNMPVTCLYMVFIILLIAASLVFLLAAHSTFVSEVVVIQDFLNTCSL